MSSEEPTSPAHSAPSKPPFKLFQPILAGADLRDRLIACVGAVLGICLTAFVSTFALERDLSAVFIAAPLGASAVLLFAVPASPMAQPWSVIGGNTISALIGVAINILVPNHILATGLAVGLAIAAMSLTRCLHPPGGAVALTAVLAASSFGNPGFSFALFPVCLNSVLLALLGWTFHRFSGHSYPHRPIEVHANLHGTSDSPPQMRVGFQTADIDSALKDFGEGFDISREDIDRLLRRVELHAFVRSHADLTCADIMSKDVISIDVDDELDRARHLLVSHAIRTIPVKDHSGRLLGAIGFHELALAKATLRESMIEAPTSRPSAPALALAPALTDASHHAVFIVDDQRHVLGVVTQTDLLSALSRPAPVPVPAG